MLEWFRFPEPKNVWFPLPRHDVRWVDKKFFSLWFARTDGCKKNFGLLSPKTFDSHFLDMMVRRVHKKFFSRWFARTDERYSHFGLLSPKTFDSHYLHTMYLEFMKTFFSPIRANWWVLEWFPPPEPKNVWFPLSRHDVPRVHEKFFVADSRELMGVRVISASWAQKPLTPTF